MNSVSMLRGDLLPNLNVRIVAQANPAVDAALQFASNAHGAVNQRRKHTHEPYIVHSIAVANLLIEHEAEYCTSAMLQAALLHDVVEDTPTSLHTIRFLFGERVAQFVGLLTDPPKREGENRAARMTARVERMARAPREVFVIKYADMFDNAQSILVHDPKFAPQFLKEVKALMDARPYPAVSTYRLLQNLISAYEASQ